MAEENPADRVEIVDEPVAPATLEEALAAFAEQHGVRTKGTLCLPLVVTDHARSMGMPLDPGKLRTGREGQVLGLGKAKVQTILGRHGITRVLAEEGGRTTRGSLGMMSAYVSFLNGLAEKEAFDLDRVEAFWIGRVRQFFAAKPFAFRVDPTLSIRSALRHLFAQAEARQKELPGTMVLGAILQHLVGAKLAGDYGELVAHHSVSTKDEGQARPGDFDLGDLAIHVSTAPGEALIRKCQANLASGQRPIIFTIGRGVALATGLAENAAIGERLDVFDIEQWLAADILSRQGSSNRERLAIIQALLSRYNEIIGAVETDPSLRIELATLSSR